MKHIFLEIILFILIVLAISGCNRTVITSVPHQMPTIEAYSFGSIVIDGKSYGDIKIYANKVYLWRPVKRHEVRIDDLQDITKEVDFIVIGTGYYDQVRVEDETLTFLNEKNIKPIIRETTKAVDEYNRLVKEGKKVATILHSTC